MKKVSLLAALAMITGATAVSAQVAAPVAAAPNCPKAFQGFHLGGNIGYGVGKGQTKHTRTITGVLGDTTTTGKHSLGFNGVDGGLGVGYTHRFGNWGLGLAFDANWANTSGSHTRTSSFNDGAILVNSTETLKARLQNSLQLYARAGYVIGGMAMPFVGLGWDNSSWKQTFSETTDGVSFSKSKSKRIDALLWKAGVDFLATKHLIVGFEYTGTAASKQKLTTTNATTDPTSTASASIKPQYNKFALTAKIVY